MFTGAVQPRFNEVPRDWGNSFVILRVRYTENLDLTNFRKNNQIIRYIEGWLIIFSFKIIVFFVVCCRATLHFGTGTITVHNICALMSML